MELHPAHISAELTPKAWRRGQRLLQAGFGFGLTLTLLALWFAPDLLPVLPALLIGGIAGAWLFRRPLVNLCVVLGTYPFIADFDPGLDLTEVLYGLYYLSYLGHWYGSRLFLYRERLMTNPGDRLLVFFGLWVTLSVGTALLFSADLADIRGEYLALTMLAFYFPVKDACIRYENMVVYLFLIFAWAGLFTAVRNAILLREILSSAEYAWQVTTKGRVIANEILMAVPALAALAWMMYARHWLHRLVIFGAFLVFLFGLIMTQSRGYWLAFAFGALVFFLLTDGRRRGHLLLLGVGSLVCFVGIGLVFFGDLVSLIFAALIDRIVSLQTASSQDISLVNRFLETKAVWNRIQVNPIVGYGPGVVYSFYDLTIMGTRTRAFIHNGYIGVWFKYGLVGLLPLLLFWVRSMWNGVQVFWTRTAPRMHRVGAVAATAGLAAMTVSALTANPFILSDTLLMFGILAGMATGLRERLALDAP